MKSSKKNVLLIVILIVLVIAGGVYYWKSMQSDSGVRNTVAQEEAITKVKNLPEVTAWMNRFTNNGTSPTTGGRPYFSIEEDYDTHYVIWVYEMIPARGEEPGHAATFAQYRVYKASGEIKKLNVETDTFE